MNDNLGVSIGVVSGGVPPSRDGLIPCILRIEGTVEVFASVRGVQREPYATAHAAEDVELCIHGADGCPILDGSEYQRFRWSKSKVRPRQVSRACLGGGGDTRLLKRGRLAWYPSWLPESHATSPALRRL